jgi:hypothetical protein
MLKMKEWTELTYSYFIVPAEQGVYVGVHAAALKELSSSISSADFCERVEILFEKIKMLPEVEAAKTEPLFPYIKNVLKQIPKTYPQYVLIVFPYRNYEDLTLTVDGDVHPRLPNVQYDSECRPAVFIEIQKL